MFLMFLVVRAECQIFKLNWCTFENFVINVQKSTKILLNLKSRPKCGFIESVPGEVVGVLQGPQEMAARGSQGTEEVESGVGAERAEEVAAGAVAAKGSEEMEPGVGAERAEKVQPGVLAPGFQGALESSFFHKFLFRFYIC
jgi:hypothetical protein